MTPEEFERSMDFIVRQQAQFHADLQRHHEEWVREEKVLKSAIVQLIELARIESERLEGHDRILERHDKMFERQDDILERQNQLLRDSKEWQKDAIARLDRILDRLTPPQQ